jgi:hypothetical protein
LTAQLSAGSDFGVADVFDEPKNMVFFHARFGVSFRVRHGEANISMARWTSTVTINSGVSQRFIEYRHAAAGAGYERPDIEMDITPRRRDTLSLGNDPGISKGFP